jgi:threonine aldolase
MNFLSDNAYGAAPEIVAALGAANSGTAASYGDDETTARLTKRFCELFERDVVVFPVLTGTAANSLSLATISPPYGAIFCHENSHLVVDECAAPEFFTGGARLVPLEGEGAKITPNTVERALARYRGGVHSAKPAAISITQATERGAVYTPDEIGAISALVRREGMALHMDGARFANAVVHLDSSPADLTWKAGVDVMSFGATKNGAICAEAVIFFDRDRVRDFEYRRKRAGHLVSKMRFISAQLEAYLADDLWVRHARIANALARHLATALSKIANVELAEPVEANEVLVRLPDSMVQKLRDAGALFYDWEPPENQRTLIRLVLSSLTPQSDVDRFIHLAGS